MRWQGGCDLCTADAAYWNVAGTCIGSDELIKALRTIQSERLIVLLDTCYSGGIGEARQRSGTWLFSPSAKVLASLIEGRGRVIMAEAWELPELKNGVFTTYLLAALRGAIARSDGTIWMSDVFSYVSREIRRHGCQHPFQKAVGEDFVLLVQNNDETRRARLPLIGAELNRTALRRMMRAAYNRAELSLLCKDLGLSLEDLPGTTLETRSWN